MNIQWKTIAVTAALAIAPSGALADCRAASPDHTVALIELYTSEGCDSCPPADRWLSGLGATVAGQRAVALALHVDYWDRLGWKDRFASATFTARQYEEMHRQRQTFVYTPQVFVQGRDFAQWRASGEPATAIAAINARPARASIELTAEPNGKSGITVDVRVRVPQGRDRAHATVAAALVQNGLMSDVKAGENAGKRLAHDHVVRQWRPGLPVDAAGELRKSLGFTFPQEPGSLSIVAFAEDTASGEVLQALALPLCTTTR